MEYFRPSDHLLATFRSDNRGSINIHSSNAGNGKTQGPISVTSSSETQQDSTRPPGNTGGELTHFLPPTETKPPYSYNGALQLQCGWTHPHYYHRYRLNFVQDWHKPATVKSATSISSLLSKVFPQK